MKSEDQVGVTFVNTVIGRGIFNGVVNLSFGVFNFTPNDEGQVDVDPAIACRMRMDRVCATQLRNALNDLLAAIEQADAAIPGSVPTPEIEAAPAKKSAKSVN